uniref:Integrase catalytic domain-containing protein n=1 Tax=Trichuris muris TaxID=70415 RepID=A0A5S6QMU4_TRIMR
MEVDGVRRTVLVDTGSSKCIICSSCCSNWTKIPVNITAVNGSELRCEGQGAVDLRPNGGGRATVEVIVTDSKPLGFDFILGMNGIIALGGVTVESRRRVRFGTESTEVCAADVAPIKLEQRDFTATFCPAKRTWSMRWKWTNGTKPDVLKNRVQEYSLTHEARASYEEELGKWISNGWLVPYDLIKHGPVKGLIPLMAVTQRNKKSVRPVMDFRELNSYIEAFTASSDICAQKLRDWRRQGANVTMLDLKRAYLQIHVDESLWPYQTVVHKGRRYCLTRLGFGLNIAPLVMKAVLSCALSQNANVQEGTSAYVDDILVNEDVVKASDVVQHLAEFGLTCKAPARVADGARVLGLKVWGENGNLYWKRDGDLSKVPESLTRRSVFSYCGRLLGHYPVCGWLRVAAAFAKRKANDFSTSWDGAISDDRLKVLLHEIAAKVESQDPVRGRWDVSGDRARVWVDASSLALGVVVETNSCVVEDAAWLRPNDAGHINMAELDALLKGLNVALSWDMRRIELMTDSSTVHRWMSDALSGKARLKTKAASEMLIRRRISTVLALVKEYGLEVTINFVRSANNKADSLTRLPRRWMASFANDAAAACVAVGLPDIKSLIARTHHEAGHPGINRTLFFARRISPLVTRRQVRDVVASCDVCRSIDPAPVRWEHGTLEVQEVWHRLAMDITHCSGRPYLTVIDCGPSRLAMWRPLKLQSSGEIIEQLESIFLERGAPVELLADNDTAFRSNLLKQFIIRWGTRIRFRCAYVPSGNGIIERCHRSVKVIAARKGCPVSEAVYLYNSMPRDDHSASSSPFDTVYRYHVRLRQIEQPPEEGQSENNYVEGDAVWVKSPGVRCDSRFQKGTVTGILSRQSVIVDGIPRHVRDLRQRSTSEEQQDESSQRLDEEELVICFPRQEVAQQNQFDQQPEPTAEGPRRSTRIRRPRVRDCCDP